MLPDLGRLRLHGPSCGRCRPQAAMGVARQDYDNDNSAECSVCLNELSAERPDRPWMEHYDIGYSYDGLPAFVMEACSNHHVFHKVCLEESYIRAMNQRVDVECPFCKASFKSQTLLMLKSRNKLPPDNNLDHPNPYAYSAVAYYEYERLRTQKKLESMSGGLSEDLENKAMAFFQKHAHVSERLADLFPVEDYVSLTQDEMKKLKDGIVNNINKTREVVVSRQELSLYQTMMEYHNKILEALVTNQHFASLMEDVDNDSDSSFDSQAVPGTPPDDDSSDDSQVVPGTPASDRGGSSRGTMGDDSDEEDPTSPDNKRRRTLVPETPPQPSPPPRSPGSAPVIVPETPPHLLNPPSS